MPTKQIETVRGKGAVLRSSLADDVTPENVRDAWANVTDMSGAEHLNSITEATGSLVEILDSLQSPASGTAGSANTAGTYSDTFTFNNKDLILYALGGLWFKVHQSRQIKWAKCVGFSRRHCEGFVQFEIFIRKSPGIRSTAELFHPTGIIVAHVIGFDQLRVEAHRSWIVASVAWRTIFGSGRRVADRRSAQNHCPRNWCVRQKIGSCYRHQL